MAQGADVQKAILAGFPQRLVRARDIAGYTSQTALADAIGATKLSVLQWENGQAEPSMDKLRALAAVLGVSTDWLLFGPRRYDLATGEPLDDLAPISAEELATAKAQVYPPTGRKPKKHRKRA